MNIIATNLTENEISESTTKVNEIRNTDKFQDQYEYNGNHAIADSFDQFYNECRPCCGRTSKELTLTSGRKVYFCFDYGH